MFDLHGPAPLPVAETAQIVPPDQEDRGRVMSAKVERTALVDRGHDPEIVRKVTVADLSADPDSQLLE